MSRRDSPSPPDGLELEPWLLEILRCPGPDQGRLTLQSAAPGRTPELWCTACDRAYPVREGIPVLLLEEARHRDEPTG